MRDYELSSLLAARLCHDLAGSIGAVENGLDLVRELDGHGVSAEMEMVAQSASRASLQLQFIRLAFGRTVMGNEPVARQQLSETVTGFLTGPRVRVEWSGTRGAALAAPLARLIALVALCARSCLGMSGMLRCKLAPDHDHPIMIAAESPSIRVSDELLLWITTPSDCTTLPEPRHVEFALVEGASHAAGMKVIPETVPGKVSFLLEPV